MWKVDVGLGEIVELVTPSCRNRFGWPTTASTGVMMQ